MVLTRRPSPSRVADDGAWPDTGLTQPAGCSDIPPADLTIAKFHAPEIMFGDATESITL
ncbi:hypothetical protein ABZ342_17865 [Amycolatopsis sp. NPDC005961]|uniref:hypothetical protein n=1 Tax=Amycolatopsis sp. NPDC005961 TaxID=3156720 RepID=UPI0034075B34